MNPLRGIESMKQEIAKIKVRLAKLEVELKEEELPYRAELGVLRTAFSSYEVVEATCNKLKLSYTGQASGRYTVEFLRGGGLTFGGVKDTFLLTHRERKMLEAISDAFVSCGDC